MKTAAAYIRVSDDRQDEYSPDSQLKLIQEYCDRNDYELPKEYIFYDDGISGRSVKKRKAFNDMIAYAKLKEHPFDVILVWKFSRFARNQEESIIYKALLKRNNVTVISISESVDDSPFAPLIERNIEFFDEYYSTRLSQEVKRGMTEKAGRGEAMCPPAFGYDIVEKKYIPNEIEAPAVRQIFRDFADGVPMRQIALALNSKGYKTHRGNPIEARTVRYILYNPLYVGKIRWTTDGKAVGNRDFKNPNTRIVDGVHEPLISTELWDEVQNKLAQAEKMYGRYQRSEQPVEWMLKGLLRCDCGATLTYLSTKCPSAQCHEYTHGKGKCTVSHCISINKANRIVIEALQASAMNFAFNIEPRQKKIESEAVDYDNLIAKERLKLDRAKEAYLSGIDDKEEYKAAKERINKRIEQIVREQEKSTKETTQELDKEAYSLKVRSVIDIITNPDVSEAEKNKALRTILTRIVFQKPQNNLALFFYV